MDWNNLVYNGLGSATASIISRILTHPLDTAKARIQTTSNADKNSTTRYKGTVDVLRRTIQTEGVLALYGGFKAIVIGGTPGTMLYLCSYDICKDYLSTTRWNMPDFSVHFVSGMVAETIACVVYVPVDVIKERLQVQQNIPSISSTFQYKGSYDALKQILKSEGLGGIYKGYGATLASFGPFSALYFVFYEKTKSLAQRYHGTFLNTNLQSSTHAQNADSLPFPYIVACSSAAGAAASWLTSPLDMAKLRLQIQRGSNNNASNPLYRNIIDCLTQTYKGEGLAGLWRGAGARVLHFTPATCITMSVYEQCRAYFASHIIL